DARTMARLQSGDLKGADDDSLRALKLNPTGTEAYTHRALIMQGMNKMAESRGWIEAALKLDPYDESAWIMRGNYFSETGRSDLAAADFKRAAQINPDNYDLYRKAIDVAGETRIVED